MTKYIISPFTNENGIESWNNYGGVLYVDGDEMDWVEDDWGLTKEEAQKLATSINNIPMFTVSIHEVDFDKLYAFIDAWINNNIKQ